jgi:alpha-L-fucosidase
MISSPSSRTVVVATLAILGIACSSKTPSGGSGGVGGLGTGGAAGGTVATSTGGAAGSSSATSSTGGNGSGGSAVGGAGGSNSGGSRASSSGLGTGGSGAGGSGGSASGSGGSGSGGTVNGGSGGSGAGGTLTGGSGPGSGGAGSGGSRAGGALGGGGLGSGGVASGGSGSGGGPASGGTSGTQACPSLPGAPTGMQPLPSAAQLSYQRTEMTAFIHFGMATFDGTEQCNPSDPVSTFAPTKLDATSVGQWVTSLKGVGFRQAMLVTKHSCGFVLWPSQYTDYSTKNSTWKGDVLKLWTDAMKANDMRVAIYYSPWDQHYTSAKSDYETYFKNQLTELMAYGNSYEFEFDGFNAPTGGNVNWKNVFSFIKQTQPNTLIWAGPEVVNTGVTPDVQWIGNENGTGSRSTSSLDTANCGGGNTWCPYECNTSSHRPNWFWHPGQNPIALADMQKNYFQTVGMNCTFNFNVPPSNTGEFDPKDVTLLQQFATWYSSLYKNDLLKGQPATSDSTWSAAGFEAAKAVDDDLCTYWAAASGKTSAQLTVTPAAPITINLISIREAIELGERVKKYHVEIQQNGTWNTAPTDQSGTKIQGTVIGNRQLWQLNGTAAQAVRLVIDSAKDSPAIAEFSVY